MKRWIIACCVVAGCQTNDVQTSSVSQNLEDCTPGGNYPDAKMPSMALWNGTVPAAGPGQMFMDNPDPYTQGRHWAVLADPGKGQIVWAAIVPDANLATYRSKAQAASNGIEPMIGDCCRPPPPPPGGGNEWLARRFLEASLRYQAVPGLAAAAADL